MRFTDTWDFKTNPTTKDDLQRSEWGTTQNDFGGKYLPGTGFPVASDWVNVKQTSADAFFDWFNGKPTYDQGKQNEISNELKNNPKTAGETNTAAKKEINH